jgi:hypothetical protein
MVKKNPAAPKVLEPFEAAHVWSFVNDSKKVASKSNEKQSA